MLLNIFVDSKYDLRSKQKLFILIRKLSREKGSASYNYPIWNFDGSSTGQAEGWCSELFIKPVATYPNPFFTKENNTNIHFVLVLCETLDKDLNPLPSNTYSNAKTIFDKKKETEPWFGIEQEYFLLTEHDIMILTEGHVEQGEYYCSSGFNKAIHRM